MRIWPEATGKSEKDTPTLTLYAPDSGKATGAAIVILPGGSYRGLAKHEGEGYARFLTAYGITAFVLKYRLGPEHTYKEIVADGMRAIFVRANVKQWNIKKKYIGIIGSSAGGHLASTVMTHYDAGDSTATDPIERASSRPDFGIVCYPVISMGPILRRLVAVTFTGTGIDRTDGPAWGLKATHGVLARRLCAACERGAAFSIDGVRTDVNGRTYVAATARVSGRTLAADLRRLGH